MSQLLSVVVNLFLFKPKIMSATLLMLRRR